MYKLESMQTGDMFVHEGVTYMVLDSGHRQYGKNCVPINGKYKGTSAIIHKTTMVIPVRNRHE